MKERLKEKIKNAVLGLKSSENWPDFEIPEIEVSYAKDKRFGDYSTNVAMALSGKVRKSPMEIAEKIKDQISKIENEDFEKIEAVAPGYINFHMSHKCFADILDKISTKKEAFGDSEIGKGKKINNEFISANPTGPLHLGNGRGGFYGDSLSRVLRKAGYNVANEYYVNDAGEQTIKLVHSVRKDEEAVYSGWYIDTIREKHPEVLTESIPVSAVIASEVVLDDFIKPTVNDKMNVDIETYLSEKNDLIERGYVDRAIEYLKNSQMIYENEGALWLETTKFGDDKDRVLVKKDGQKTYFASDCGYILNKKERGFDEIIEIWGADHHGYIGRFRAAAEALGLKKDQVRFIIVQLVKLVKDGKEVRMSKRAGNVVYIDELIDKVGHDVARFIFLMYSPDTHMNFDLGLAEEKSEKNPVFYVQYAHARIASIIRKASDAGQASSANLDLLTDEKELSLMRELAKFPGLIEEISESYEVHKLPYYAIGLADRFHSFYNACRVIDADNPEMTGARLALVKAVKIVLGETLRLIGVDAPERM